MILFFLLSLPIYSQQFIISDYDLTNQDWTWDQYDDFYSNFPGNRFSRYDKLIIYQNCRMFTINYKAVLAKLHCENDLLKNNSGPGNHEFRKYTAMGYGGDNLKNYNGIRVYKYGGFSLQMYLSLKKLSEKFRQFTNGVSVPVKCKDFRVQPDNAASYALYRYTPFYYTHKIGKVLMGGNKKYAAVHKFLKELK